MRLIGINGFKGSGKDTSYALLRDLLWPSNVERAAFADKLKTAAAAALGFDRSPEEAVALMDSFKETALISVLYAEPDNPLRRLQHDLTGREYLQWFGEKHRKVFGDSFWIDQVLGAERGERGAFNLAAAHPNVDYLVVTDVRYPNEAERVLDLGGVVWEVIRPGLKSDGHASERPLPTELISRVIVNGGSIQDLSRRLEAGVDAL